MSTSVTLPALGESVTEGTVSRWLKQVGDTVEVDEALVEISTDKVDTEVPSPVAGTVLEIKAGEDETVEVGAVLVIIGDEGETSDSGSGDSAQAEPEASQDTQAEPETPQDTQEAQTSAGGRHESLDAEARDQAASEGQADAAEQPKPTGDAKKSSGSGTEVALPALGESVTEGTVSRWLKQIGDTVEVDEALVEISTDKVDTEVPSPVAGTITDIRVNEDDTVEVGGVLCVIGDAEDADRDDQDDDEPQPQRAARDDTPEPEQAPEQDETVEGSDAGSVESVESQADAGDEGGQAPIPAPTAAASSQQESPKQESPKQEAPPQGKPKPAAPRASGDDEAAYVTPLVRKLAAEHNVDLAALKGTGVGGRIRKQDVLAAAEEAKKAAAEEARKAAAEDAEKAIAAPAAGEKPATTAPATATSSDAQAKRGTTEKLSRMRMTIAKRMVESLQVSAQLTATVEVDVTLISRLRAQVKDDFKQRNGASLSYLPFVTKAAVEALRQFPKVNATIDTEAGTVTYSDAEHIGMAVDTERGLMVPVIKDAGDLNIGGIAKKIADLASRTRSGKVTPDDLTGGTFTITNYGSAGTLFDTPIINQPQVAILGTGALVKRPMVMTDTNLGETIAVRDMMYLSLSYDHRLVDGADAARFLTVIKDRLEEGDFGSEFGL